MRLENPKKKASRRRETPQRGEAGEGGALTEVVRLEADLADDELLGLRVLRGLVCVELVVTQHAQERRLAGVVQAEEEDARLLVVEAERRQHVVEPVDDEHGGFGACGRLRRDR